MYRSWFVGFERTQNEGVANGLQEGKREGALSQEPRSPRRPLFVKPYLRRLVADVLVQLQRSHYINDPVFKKKRLMFPTTLLLTAQLPLEEEDEVITTIAISFLWFFLLLFLFGFFFLFALLLCSLQLDFVIQYIVRLENKAFGLVWFGLVWFGLVWFGLVLDRDVRTTSKARRNPKATRPPREPQTPSSSVHREKLCDLTRTRCLEKEARLSSMKASTRILICFEGHWRDQQSKESETIDTTHYTRGNAAWTAWEPRRLAKGEFKLSHHGCVWRVECPWAWW